MKIEIRCALENELSGLQVSERDKKKMLKEMQNSSIPKHFMRLVMALMLMILMLVGGAMMSESSVFDALKEKWQRIKTATEKNGVQGISQIKVQSDLLGESIVTLDSVYYDGYSLTAGYAVENGVHFSDFTPSAEQLAQKTHGTEIDFILNQQDKKSITDPGQLAVYERLLAAKSGLLKGEAPFAVEMYYVMPDYYVQAEGISVGSVWGSPHVKASSLDTKKTGVIRDFEYPLPEKLQGKTEITLDWTVTENRFRFYFDGDQLYALPGENKMAGQLQTTVQSAKGAVCQWNGAVEVDGHAGQIDISISAMHATMTIVFEEKAFATAFDEEYHVLLFDETQQLTRKIRGAVPPDGKWVCYLEGTGALPRELRVYAVKGNQYSAPSGNQEPKSLKPIFSVTME